AMTEWPFTHRFASGITITLEPALVAELKLVIDDYYRQSPLQGDLADDIAELLARRGPATAYEIGRGLRRRTAAIRALLIADERFTIARPPPSRTAKAKTWTLAANAS